MNHSESDNAGSTRRRSRVLHVIKGLGLGGAERLLVDMLAGGDRESFEYEAAYVLTRHDDLAPAMRDSMTPVHDLGARGDWDVGWLLSLRRLIVDRRYDIVHFHLPYTAALGRLALRTIPRGARPRVVYTEHSMWYEVTLPVRALNRAGIASDDALVVVSQASRQALPRALRDRARVVVHGIDLSDSPKLVHDRNRIALEVREELDVPPEDVLVLTVANLRIEKGYDVLLEAVDILSSRGVAARFISVGHGQLDEDLRARHRELGLGDRFKFLGLRTDVLRLMAGSDVFALPSHFEGLPVTLMEATSVGLPIVATAVGEIPRIFADGIDGLIVPPGRSDVFADAVERLVRDASLRKRMSASSLEHSKQFDVSAASRQVEQIYRELLDQTS